MKSIVVFVALSFTIYAGAIVAPNDTYPRIIKGKNGTKGQFPHQALLFMSFTNGKNSTCGGSVISNKWVLTAAHCVNGADSVQVHLGAWHIRAFDEPGRLIINASSFFTHPLYFPLFILNDVALVQLPYAVQFTDLIQPIQLPQSDDNFHNTSVITSGFGLINENTKQLPDIIQWADMRTIDNIRCAHEIGKPLEAWVLRRNVICVIGDAGVSSCYGDSGGPLITHDNVLIGVTSFGNGCENGSPSVFARVTTYIDWIQMSIAGVGVTNIN